MSPARTHADVLVLCADLPVALDFWQGVFGFACARHGTQRASLKLGAQSLEFFAPEPPPPRHPGALYAGTGIRVLGVLLDDLDGVCARLAARGHRIASAPALPGSWPIRFVRDPEGNMLELIGLPDSRRAEALDRVQIGLTVADADRSRRFYGERLGLPEHPARPMGEGMTRHAFSVGDTTLKFWRRPEPLPNLAGPPGAALGLRAIRIVLAPGDDTLARARAWVEPQPIAAGLPDHAGSVWIRDPDDNWIELREAR